MQGPLKNCAVALALAMGLLSACRVGPGRAGQDGACPEEMAPIPGLGACIDRYEAFIEDRDGRPTAMCAKGTMPAVETSFDQALEACTNAGKRLCTLAEWDRACEGKEKRTYPYGSSFDAAACNGADLYADPSASAPKPSGAMPKCTTPEGVFDLSGNLWEWVDEKDGSGNLRLLRGGGYSNKYYLLDCRTEKNAFQPVDKARRGYGFRCCKNGGPP
jgi:formylglycine-generating enzyme required for sulfatase activity